jgi:hypothetical protein
MQKIGGGGVIWSHLSLKLRPLALVGSWNEGLDNGIGSFVGCTFGFLVRDSLSLGGGTWFSDDKVTWRGRWEESTWEDLFGTIQGGWGELWRQGVSCILGELLDETLEEGTGTGLREGFGLLAKILNFCSLTINYLSSLVKLWTLWSLQSNNICLSIIIPTYIY